LIFDIVKREISHTQAFKGAEEINDIAIFDGSQYLLATNEGLIQATKVKLVKHFYKM